MYDWKMLSSYVAVGIISVGVQFSVLTVLIEKMQINPTLASTLGFLIGCIAQYVLLYYWTFRSKGKHSSAALRYTIITAATLFLNGIFFWTLTEVLRFDYLISQVIATATVSIINFFLYRGYAFTLPEINS